MKVLNRTLFLIELKLVLEISLVCDLIKAQSNELLSNFNLNPTKMLNPLSDMSISTGVSSDENGDLQEGVFIIGGCKYGYNAENCVEVTAEVSFYDPTLGLFSRRKKSPFERYRHCSARVLDKIWVFGGRDSKDNLVDEVVVYEPVFDKWIKIGRLPSDVTTSDFVTFSKGDDVFLMGGYNHLNEAVSSTYKIDTDDVWDEYILKKSFKDAFE